MLKCLAVKRFKELTFAKKAALRISYFQLDVNETLFGVSLSYTIEKMQETRFTEDLETLTVSIGNILAMAIYQDSSSPFYDSKNANAELLPNSEYKIVDLNERGLKGSKVMRNHIGLKRFKGTFVKFDKDALKKEMFCSGNQQINDTTFSIFCSTGFPTDIDFHRSYSELKREQCLKKYIFSRNACKKNIACNRLLLFVTLVSIIKMCS